jgi:hypothetical protein
MAARLVKDAGTEVTAMAGQLSRRILEAASEFREQWEDFLAEAQSDKNHAAWSSVAGERRAATHHKEPADGACGAQLRSKTRSRRSTRVVPT